MRKSLAGSRACCPVGWKTRNFERKSALTSDLDKRTETAAKVDRLPKIAELIANGEIPIPVDWPEDRLLPLLDLVHAARRRRLVQYFARLIASDICRIDRQEE